MANEKLTQEEIVKTKKMEEFLKQAFCIDGDCNYIEDVTVNSSLKTTVSAMFSLGDSKRGLFYVTLSK